MPHEGLPPRVQDAQDADLGAQMARARGHLSQGGGTSLKEPRVQLRRVPVAQRQQCVGEREDDVDVRHVEQLALARGEPPLTGLRLTLRTVSIPTRVIRNGPMSTGAAVIDVPAEGGGPTARERAQHGALLHAEPRMSFDKSVTLRVEDIGHLHGGPTHD